MTKPAAPESFAPAALLRNPHLQSVASRIPGRRRQIVRGARMLTSRAERWVVDGGDGIRLAGSLSRADGQSRGLVVLLHGWEGCADSPYMLSAGSRLLAEGFDVFRLNLRDHGDTHDLNEELFHSCRIDEVVNAIGSIGQRLEPRRLALVGHSLGGNFAVRVAVRAPGRGIAVDRVIAIAPVLRPASTMRALEDGFWLYRRYFLARWRESLYRKAALFPARYRFGDLRRFPTLTSTTEFFVEQYTEFGTLAEYLEGYAIVGDRLAALEVPTRLIFAADDPVIPSDDIGLLARPPALEIERLRYGGHCGFVERLSGPSWVDVEVLDDLKRRL